MFTWVCFSFFGFELVFFFKKMSTFSRSKRDFISSLKLGDIVIVGQHIGCLRYLGPLNPLNINNNNNISSKTSININNNNISSFYAGIELVEPNGHMNGSIDNTCYFKIKTKTKLNNNNSNNNNNNNNNNNDNNNYGILTQAIQIEKIISGWNLLKKITKIFNQLQRIKKQLKNAKLLIKKRESIQSKMLSSINNNSNNPMLISQLLGNDTPMPPLLHESSNKTLNNNIMNNNNNNKIKMNNDISVDSNITNTIDNNKTSKDRYDSLGHIGHEINQSEIEKLKVERDKLDTIPKYQAKIRPKVNPRLSKKYAKSIPHPKNIQTQFYALNDELTHSAPINFGVCK